MNEVDTRTIILVWREGSHGGFDQVIHFQTSRNNQVWTEQNTVSILANDFTVLRNTTLTNLLSSRFYLRLFASNSLGISDMSEIWNITVQGVEDVILPQYCYTFMYISNRTKLNL